MAPPRNSPGNHAPSIENPESRHVGYHEVVRSLIVLVLIAAPGCVFGSGPPQYMTEAARGAEGARRALERIQAELGPDFETRLVDDLFFIASNGDSRSLDAAEATVRRMTDHLYRHFFTRRPVQAVRVYCFRDSSTYSEYVRSAYGRPPTTPYGFYMASERKMVLNLGTGMGTLSHEIVHPLIGEDFPGVPAWFNEGFASLYEYSSRNGEGRMVPKVNWRLGDLRRARLEGREVALRTLMETNSDEFYGDDRGVHYAMARYFCFYLERQGLLERFYREYRATVDADPSGVSALERVTRRSLADVETEWRSWVAGLR